LLRYSQLGSSGLVVSKLAFGTMTLGNVWTGPTGPLAAIDELEAAKIVATARNNGVNFFDVADAYHEGQSEIILGRALAGQRKDVVIATKVGMRTGGSVTQAGLSARHIHASLDASLKRLGTDWIDIYICHLTDPITPLVETLAALDQTVRSGKVRYLGFSNWPAWLAAKAVVMQESRGWARFVTGQMYYSLVCRDIEHEYLPMAQDAGIGTMVWSPLAGGFLSGKYNKENPSGAGGRLDQMEYELDLDRERGYRIVDVLRTIGAARGVPTAAVALAWLLDQPTVATAIIGITREAQLMDNLRASDLILSREEHSAIEAVASVTSPYPNSFLKRESDSVLLTAKADHDAWHVRN
jgi:aryl-alcohol dehydrogenase-like predicted oxidoreductase